MTILLTGPDRCRCILGRVDRRTRSTQQLASQLVGPLRGGRSVRLCALLGVVCSMLGNGGPDLGIPPGRSFGLSGLTLQFGPLIRCRSTALGLLGAMPQVGHEPLKGREHGFDCRIRHASFRHAPHLRRKRAGRDIAGFSQVG